MKKRVAVLTRYAAALSLVFTAHGVSAETITVSAAASLADAFTEIAARFSAAYPEDSVQLNFGASGSLLQQILKGAPVDVFASADEVTMNRAEDRGWVVQGTRQSFVQNTLVLIQPANAGYVLDSIDALHADTVQRIAVGNPESVPVGRYAKHSLKAAGQWDALLEKMILAQNVRQALDYVARGEVDAGFVYGTDAVLMKGKVKVSYTVPTEQRISYPVAVLQHGEGKPAAQRFVDLLLSEEGQGVLAGFGFERAH
ncbi:molybdate ABC transporter substrate-binding protein [Achromobacter sp. F4_2707]|uniref:molybdate ABC transporter substrate-binding protein n=1 Tax=Achromobacter sp. F4_2707 TaxID=3114286 RepID=UPI0039C63658